MAHLWEIDHPYHCTEGNFFSNDCHLTYPSWPEFLDAEGHLDPDMNLVFRWDWTPNEYLEDESAAGLAAYHARFDDNYRAYTLSIFWVGQRKAILRSTEVSVCRADEPSVREWLTDRAEHMRKVWEPLLDAPTGGAS